MKNLYNTSLNHLRNTAHRCVTSVARAIHNDAGQGISEYLIILAVVVIAAIALATTFSGELTGLWESITSQLSAIA